MYIDKIEILDIGRNYWQNQLETDIEASEWYRIWKSVFQNRLIQSTKIRYFQYRVLCCKLVTKLTRSKWDSQVSAKCSFCNVEQETIKHLLLNCDIVNKKIWKLLTKWLCYMCKEKIFWWAQNCFEHVQGHSKYLYPHHQALYLYNEMYRY